MREKQEPNLCKGVSVSVCSVFSVSVQRSFWLWNLGITENNRCASEMLHLSLQDCADSHFPAETPCLSFLPGTKSVNFLRNFC